MIYRAIEVTNMIGIYKGLKLDTLKLDFEENGFNVFSGKNGSGKTTLMRFITPFSEDKVELIEDGVSERAGNIQYKEAKKLLWVEQNGVNYLIQHLYSKSGTKKSFLGTVEDKHSLEVLEEFNPNGNVTSFNTLVEDLFNMSPNDIGNSIITTTESSSFLEMTSEERKKSIASLIPDVSVYIEHYKRVREKVKSVNNQISYIIEDIKQSGGNREDIQLNIDQQKELLSGLESVYNSAVELTKYKFGELKSVEGSLLSTIPTHTNNVREGKILLQNNINQLNNDINSLLENASQFEEFNKTYTEGEISSLNNQITNITDVVIQGMHDVIRQNNSKINELNSQKNLAYQKNELYSQWQSRLQALKEGEVELNNKISKEDEEFWNSNKDKFSQLEAELSELRVKARPFTTLESHVLDDVCEFYPVFKTFKDKETEFNTTRQNLSNSENIIKQYNELINSAAEFN